MNPASGRLEWVFAQARQLESGDERAAFLDQACAGDSSLREQVEQLLAADETAGDFLRTDGTRHQAPSEGSSVHPDLSGRERAAVESAPAVPRLEGYQIIRTVGQGGMGVVYEARNLSLDRPCAVKTLLPERVAEAPSKFLRREAKLAASLRHPNIVAVHDYLSSASPPCIVMEWVDGIPLDRITSSFDDRRRATLCMKVARAVDYAHRNGVIHRDLKPGNILVDRFGEPRILDFGLARLVSPDEPTEGQVKGTPLYMAPEQFSQPETVGPAADIYALGLIMFALLVDRPPPAPTTSGPREIPEPRTFRPGIPESLQRICLKACEAMPSERYASAGQLAEDLERYLAGEEVRARPTRYRRLLRERVDAHLADVARWEEERLISAREADSIEARYQGLLQADGQWAPNDRRLRVGMLLIQLGGWLVVLSACLWVWFYWTQLSNIQRIAATGIPAVLVNSVGFVLWRRSSDFVALQFTVFGTLLLPLFGLVVVSELGLLTGRAMAESGYELLPPDFFSNRQLAAVFWGATCYGVTLLWRRRYAVLAAVVGAIGTLAYAATLLLFGLRSWVEDEAYVSVAAGFLPWVLVLYGAAWLIDRRSAERLAGPLYALSTIGLLLVAVGLALDAPKTWMGLEPAESELQPDYLAITRELFFVCSGLVFLIVAIWHDTACTRLRRFWGRMYFRVVPPFCVVPLDLLGDQPLWSLGKLGTGEFQAAELLVPLACLSLMAIGTRLQIRWFNYYGLVHLAVYLVAVTRDHFGDRVSWPFLIVAVGALAMVVGLVAESRLNQGKNRRARTAA